MGPVRLTHLRENDNIVYVGIQDHTISFFLRGFPYDTHTILQSPVQSLWVLFWDKCRWFWDLSLWPRNTLAGAWAGGTEYGVIFFLLNKFVCFVVCVTFFPFVISPWSWSFHSFLRELLRTNSVRKIPDSRFASIHDFQRIFYQICWAGAIFRRIIQSDITDGLTDGLTDWQTWVTYGSSRLILYYYLRSPPIT